MTELGMQGLMGPKGIHRSIHVPSLTSQGCVALRFHNNKKDPGYIYMPIEACVESMRLPRRAAECQ